MTDPKELISSIIVQATITCNYCLRMDGNEDTKDNIFKSAEYFYNEGWRIVNGLALCPDCIEKQKSLKLDFSLE